MPTFEELGLQEKLLKAVDELGFTQPTPIQEKAIPVLLSGTKDLIGLAQTGTGKTAAYGLPLLQLAEAGKRHAVRDRPAAGAGVRVARHGALHHDEQPRPARHAVAQEVHEHRERRAACGADVSGDAGSEFRVAVLLLRLRSEEAAAQS